MAKRNNILGGRLPMQGDGICGQGIKNLAVVKPGCRIDLPGQQVGKIAAALGHGRNNGQIRLRLADAGALVIAKKEGSVPDNGAAESPAKLVLLERGNRQGGVVEVILCVHGGVAQELKGAAMELIAARLQ